MEEMTISELHLAFLLGNFLQNCLFVYHPGKLVSTLERVWQDEQLKTNFTDNVIMVFHIEVIQV